MAIPFVSTALAFAAVAVTSIIKTLFTGTLKPVVKPLWSRFVWHNELVNGVYESIAAAAMQPLMGTPLIGAVPAHDGLQGREVVLHRHHAVL